MMMTAFKIGDVVELKSGSPKMTVHDIGDFSISGGPNPGILCVWFTAGKEESVFHPDALQLYQTPAPLRVTRG
jgi:uncharacterized protein YodC (DUF2158 family)